MRTPSTREYPVRTPEYREYLVLARRHDTIVEEGDYGLEMYVVMKGTIQVLTAYSWVLTGSATGRARGTHRVLAG